MSHVYWGDFNYCQTKVFIYLSIHVWGAAPPFSVNKPDILHVAAKVYIRIVYMKFITVLNWFLWSITPYWSIPLLPGIDPHPNNFITLLFKAEWALKVSSTSNPCQCSPTCTHKRLIWEVLNNHTTIPSHQSPPFHSWVTTLPSD